MYCRDNAREHAAALGPGDPHPANATASTDPVTTTIGKRLMEQDRSTATNPLVTDPATPTGRSSTPP